MSDKGQLTWEILKDQLKKVRKDNWNKDRIIKEQETALAEHGMEIESLTAKLQAAEAEVARLRAAMETDLIYVTSRMDEHPEGYEGACWCRSCCSYATDDGEGKP